VFATTIDTVVFDWLVVLIVPIVLAFCECYFIQRHSLFDSPLLTFPFQQGGVFMSKKIIIFSTSLCGSYGIMAAIDYFAFGAGNGYRSLKYRNTSLIQPRNNRWLLGLLPQAAEQLR